MITARAADLDATLNVESSGIETDEDPLRDPFAASAPERPPARAARPGWRAAAALLLAAGLAACAVAAVLRGGRLRLAVARASAAESKFAAEACLCLFDVDRTLTGKQQMTDKCPGNLVQPGIFDNAFSGGDLTLSALGQGVRSTFCGGCYRGIVSAGGAGGPTEKAVLDRQLRVGDLEPVWSGPADIRSQYVIGCPNERKALCARGIVDWFADAKGIFIPPEEVYFFDDFTGNTAGFAAQGFNARQVSCHSREGSLGFCGGQPWEVVREKGVKDC